MDDLPLDLLLAGAGSLLVAVAAWFADRRRMRRADPDAVGFMPWTTVFFWALLAACLLLAGGTRMSLAG